VELFHLHLYDGIRSIGEEVDEIEDDGALLPDLLVASLARLLHAMFDDVDWVERAFIRRKDAEHSVLQEVTQRLHLADERELVETHEVKNVRVIAHVKWRQSVLVDVRK